MVAAPVVIAVNDGSPPEPPNGSREPDPESDPDPRIVSIVGGCLYLVLLIAGLGWLWARDRLGLLSDRAIGDFGAPAAVGVGLGIGLLGALVFVLVVHRTKAGAELTEQARRMFVPMGDAALALLVWLGAVAEEIFFRLAVQDQFGLPGSVAAYGVLSMCGLGVRWLPFALLHALVLGGLVQLGFGLLASAAANAVMNYLALRRILTL